MILRIFEQWPLAFVAIGVTLSIIWAAALILAPLRLLGVL